MFFRKFWHGLVDSKHTFWRKSCNSNTHQFVQWRLVCNRIIITPSTDNGRLVHIAGESISQANGVDFITEQQWQQCILSQTLCTNIYSFGLQNLKLIIYMYYKWQSRVHRQSSDQIQSRKVWLILEWNLYLTSYWPPPPPTINFYQMVCYYYYLQTIHMCKCVQMVYILCAQPIGRYYNQIQVDRKRKIPG